MIDIQKKITNVNTLKERLQYVRELRGLSQGELARLAKCSQSTIGNIESGERDTLRNLVVVARVLRCSADWLYDGYGPKPVKMDTHNTAPDVVPAVAREDSAVTYLPAKKNPLHDELLELFGQLDEEGKKQWLADLGGFVRGRRPHTLGTAPALAGK